MMSLISIAANLVIVVGASMSGYFYGHTKGYIKGYKLGLSIATPQPAPAAQSEE